MKLRISLIVISSLFVIIGLSIKINKNYRTYEITKKELGNINNYIYNKGSSEYIFIIEIPKIGLKKGINDNNNVDKGIVLLDYKKYLIGDIIVASHSGNCDVCYFNRLDELDINDEIYVYKDNIKYIYKIVYIIEKKKNTFKIDDSINTITLITCKKNKDDIQLIIKGELLFENVY